MNYDKLIADAATKLNGLVNEIINALDKEGTPVNPGTIINDLTAKAFPEKDGVTQLDKDDPVIDYDPKTGESFVTTAGDAGLDDESMSALRKKFSTQEDDSWGEQQAEGLDNLLEGLRDTPHDNRW